MKRILLLIDRRGNREQLAKWLGTTSYRIWNPGHVEQLPDETFGMALVDRSALNRLGDALRKRQRAAAPIQVPVVLIDVRAQVPVSQESLGRQVEKLIASRNRSLRQFLGLSDGADIDELDEEAVERKLVVNRRLKQAVEGDALELHYQPIVTLGRRRMVGAEALCRWEDPQLGRVSPGVFIPVAERSDLIVDLGRWTLRQACDQVAAWDRHEGPDVPYVSVNIAASHFNGGTLLDDAFEAVSEAGLEPGRLKIELTERALAGSEVVESLADLSRAGFRVMIDDFGTGYSCLAKLFELEMDSLKLDRSFLQGLGSNPRCEQVTDMVIDLARKLQLNLIMEGVETEDQVKQLRKMVTGFSSFAQGYLFGRPVAGSQLTAPGPASAA
ncbi:MAG: EAL domain-containing protein [Phycisphaeraceae bacterium]|nr:EAL domain-containing protein [Phycisphaeraceae bacterium]